MFRVPLRWFYVQKFEDGVMGSGQKISIFHFSWNRLATAGRSVTRQAISAHTGAGGLCAEAIETGVGADGLACILHMGTRNRSLGWAKSRMGLLM